MNETELLKEIKEKIEYLSTHNKNYNKLQYQTILDIEEMLEDYQNNKILGSYDELDEETKDQLKFSLYPTAKPNESQSYSDRLTDDEAKQVYNDYCMDTWTYEDFKENGVL